MLEFKIAFDISMNCLSVRIYNKYNSKQSVLLLANIDMGSFGAKGEISERQQALLQELIELDDEQRFIEILDDTKILQRKKKQYY